jgi:hypothetical protein
MTFARSICPLCGYWNTTAASSTCLVCKGDLAPSVTARHTLGRLRQWLRARRAGPPKEKPRFPQSRRHMSPLSNGAPSALAQTGETNACKS